MSKPSDYDGRGNDQPYPTVSEVMSLDTRERDTGGNYIADCDTFPSKVWFANGRKVSVECAQPALEGPQPYLVIEREMHPAFADMQALPPTAKQLLDMAAKQRAELDDLDEWNPDYFACFTGDCQHDDANQCLISVQADANTTFAALRQERHQVEVYRKQMAKAEADCEANKNAATYWWTRFYAETKQERPRAFDSSTEEFAASHEALLKERDALRSSLQAVDKEWGDLKASLKKAGMRAATIGGEMHIIPTA